MLYTYPLFTAFSTPAITLRVNGSNSKIVFCDQKQQSKLKPSDDFAPNGKLEVITTASFDQTPNWASRWEDLLATDKSLKEEARFRSRCTYYSHFYIWNNW